MDKELLLPHGLTRSERQRAYDVFQLCSILLIPAMCTLKDESLSSLVAPLLYTNA